DPWDIVLSDYEREPYRRHARAVLEALRDPDMDMVEAGDDVVVYHPDDIIRNRAEAIWQAMIDKALGK
ncbi:MAG: hypothetical protein WC889_02725, partial [Myxococcota bacterium]